MGRRAAGRFAEWGVFRSLQLLQLRSDTTLIFSLNTRSHPTNAVSDNPDAWGADVGVCLGNGAVLHLSQKLSVPAIERIEAVTERVASRAPTNSSLPCWASSFETILKYSSKAATFVLILSSTSKRPPDSSSFAQLRRALCTSFCASPRFGSCPEASARNSTSATSASPSAPRANTTPPREPRLTPASPSEPKLDAAKRHSAHGCS